MAEKISVPGDAGPAWGGVQDPTLEGGQIPKSMFGMDATGFFQTGAQGTAGAAGQPEGDPTNQPGQYQATEPISGVSLTGGTGAPGGPGANPAGRPESGGAMVMITDPNYTAGRPGGGSGNQFIPVPAAVGGGGDATTLPGQYDSGVPNAMPSMSQPADAAPPGRVLHGGWMNGKR